MKMKGLRRLDDTIRHSGGSGDNWHMTWAKNGSQYTGLCDGKGWSEVEGLSGKEYNTRVLKLDGPPEDPKFSDLPGFPELESHYGTLEFSRYYGFGILALDDAIYHYLSTPNHQFLEPGATFAGVKLVYSPDNGQTWCNQDKGPLVWEEWDDRNHSNMLFFKESDYAFSLISVLQMGQNYEYNRDGYVYLYSPGGSTEGKMNQLALCRVPKDKILERQSYEFFVSRLPDGGAKWSADIAEFGSVHTFPSGWVNTIVHPYSWHPCVVYNPGLGLYMMANWGMGAGDDGEWFVRPAYLGFWTSETPWGPWTLIHEEEAWLNKGNPATRGYQPQISPKWIAPDGKSFWLVWTDWELIDDTRPYYCFNWQKVELDF